MLARRSAVLTAQGRAPEADAAIRDAIRLWRGSVATATPQVPRWLLRQSQTVAAQGRTAEADCLGAEARALCDGLGTVPQQTACIADADAALRS